MPKEWLGMRRAHPHRCPAQQWPCRARQPVRVSAKKGTNTHTHTYTHRHTHRHTHIHTDTHTHTHTCMLVSCSSLLMASMALLDEAIPLVCVARVASVAVCFDSSASSLVPYRVVLAATVSMAFLFSATAVAVDVTWPGSAASPETVACLGECVHVCV
jgi:hypothetical protein